MQKKIRNTNLNFDPEFRFLLDLDPAFEEWRNLAVKWLSSYKKSYSKRSILRTFFVTYLHGQQVDKRPAALFEPGTRLPDLIKVLRLDQASEHRRMVVNDAISDLLEWVLCTKLAHPDGDGHLIVPAHLKNPFPRKRLKSLGKRADTTFAYVSSFDPKTEHWQKLASEWLVGKSSSMNFRRRTLDMFLIRYIVGGNMERNPITFLTRTTPKTSFIQTLVSSKIRGAVGSITAQDIKANNYIHEFLNWVLMEKLSIDDDHGHRVVPSELHNPVPWLSQSGLSAPAETIKFPLSIRYIKELRAMLAEGPNFRDWTWAQEAMEGGANGSDWFMVNSRIVNRDDPDCVWRERETTRYEQDQLGLPARVTELWSPVRALALYIKLELPLRTIQVRMLDSGEADTWRYESEKFVLNDSPLAIGSEKHPYQRGVFHRSVNQSGAGLYINTNKSADINKPENEKGFVIPWTHETVLYWLEKLRNWQERYNPLNAPTPWLVLESKHLSARPHPEVLKARGTACFLFRDAAASEDDKHKPLADAAITRIWYLLLARLEQRCLERGETLDDGTPIRFVDPDSYISTHYPLHSLRVSLISYLVLDLNLPLPVVSKLIAGHARIIMTLYYTKFGQAYMKEVLAEAERKMLAADEVNHRRFLMDATMDQISKRFASVSVDAVHATVTQRSAAGFVFEDKGICPVGGGMCDVGGELITEWKTDKLFGPVPGYPQERNCVRCRFFLTGPAFLPGLQAHFNSLSYEAHERSARHNELHEEVTNMENRRADCERNGRLFTETRELERLSQRYEAEAEAMGKLINDMQACHYLIARSLEITKQADKEGVQLVAVGEMPDIHMAFTEASSELHQIEVLCENAIIYPEIDARKPVLRRSQLLDLMLDFNGMPPIFFRLNSKQQLQVGNAVMKLIQARTGSLKGAVEYVEGMRRLSELGIVDETWDVIAEGVTGTPAREIIDAARTRQALPFS